MNQKTESQPQSSGGSTQGQPVTPADQSQPAFDPEETAEVSIPIGVPMTDAEFRQLKRQAEQSSPPTGQPAGVDGVEPDEDPPED
jgi:hypothetical protein